jgi:hypothetical protein
MARGPWRARGLFRRMRCEYLWRESLFHFRLLRERPLGGRASTTLGRPPGGGCSFPWGPSLPPPNRVRSLCRGNVRVFLI